MKRLLVWFLCLLLVGMVGGVLAQDDDGTAQLAIAVSNLGARLGIPLGTGDLSNWSFTIQEVQNTAMNCGSAEGTPTSESFDAFVFDLEYQGVGYDVRVSRDGSLVVLCNVPAGAPPPTADPNQQPEPVPATGAPATPAQVQTRPCPADFGGYLEPKLQLNQQGRIEAGGVPNRVRAEPSVGGVQTGVIRPGSVVTVVGGPSCGDGIVWWQVNYNGLVGWTAEGTTADGYFIEPFGITATSTPPSAAGAQTVGAAEAVYPPAQVVGSPPPMAALTDQGVMIFAPGAQPIVVPGTDETRFGSLLAASDLTWSPDGQRLAYVRYNGDTPAELMLTDAAGNPPVTLATDIVFFMPPSFSADGTQIIYATEGGIFEPTDAEPTGGAIVNVMAQGLSPDSPAQMLGSFAFSGGCGGAGDFPPMSRYWDENGFTGQRPVLEVTAFGIVHSISCDYVGVGLLNPQSGTSIILSDDLSRVKVSPDRAQIAGVAGALPFVGAESDTSLQVIDLATTSGTEVETATLPDQVAWGLTGDLYYSAREVSGEQAVPAQLTDRFGSNPFELFISSIYRVDLATGEDEQIFAADAYAIGRMFVAGDGQLYFTVIPNVQTWIQGIADGTINANDDNQTQLAFPLLMYGLPTSGGEATLIGSELNAAVPNRTAFAG